VTDPPVVLTIGGWDSSGCHGVPADLRTLAARQVHGTGALTVVTAQDTSGIRAISAVPLAAIAEQIEAVLDDLPVAAVKTGMLGRAEVVELVGALAAAGRLPGLVVDPVLVDRHGRPLFGDEVVEAYRRRLLPHAAVICPNEIEAALLLRGDDGWHRDDGRTGDGEHGARGYATQADVLGRGLGVPTVVTAGRAGGEQAVDVLWDGTDVVRLQARRIATVNNAGSGDAFSAHVAASLATGAGVRDAVTDAKRRVHDALRAGARWRLGSGPGPLDHFGWSDRRAGS
jgi:hydroxymethylpyrimidine/phosphomethylpyrimidine kinase